MQVFDFRKAFKDASLPSVRARVAALGGAILLSVVAVLFARAGEWAQTLFAVLYRVAPLSPLVLTPLVFAGVVWATRRWFPAARGSGIPQVMAAGHNPTAAARGPLVSMKSAVGTSGARRVFRL